MAKKTVSLETKSVGFDFGEAGSVEVGLDQFDAEIVTRLALHGLSQKCGDSYASAKKATEGTDIDPAVWARGQVEAVVEQLVKKDWTTRTPGAGGAVTDLATALAEVVGCPVEEAVARLADAEKEEKAGLRKHPDIAAVLSRIKAERAAAKAQKDAEKAGSGPDLSEFMS